MIYRGQKYGDPVGTWWTTSRDEALKFAMSRGGNRTYVILSLDEEDAIWLDRWLTYDRAGDGRGDWFNIPLEELAKRWRGVKIDSGAISIESYEEVTIE